MSDLREALEEVINERHATLILRHDFTTPKSRETNLDAFEAFFEDVFKRMVEKGKRNYEQQRAAKRKLVPEDIEVAQEEAREEDRRAFVGKDRTAEEIQLDNEIDSGIRGLREQG